ncbi:MAG TPA: hypothetical protein VGR52_01520 [Stellaceae bacterium]|nr:hypothetical protein [Stellaceae bacterium]
MTQNAIEAANATLAHLETKKAETERRIATLAEAREKLSFGALTGDEAKAKRLARLSSDAATAHGDLENICSAITEARRRVETAEGEAAVAATREKAHDVLGDCGEMERLAAEVDAALVGAATTIANYLLAADRLSRCGVRAAPNYRLVQLAVARAISVHLRAPLHDLIELPMVAPGQRRPLAETSGVPIRGLRAWARSMLGDVTAPELLTGDAMKPERGSPAVTFN